MKIKTKAKRTSAVDSGQRQSGTKKMNKRISMKVGKKHRFMWTMWKKWNNDTQNDKIGCTTTLASNICAMLDLSFFIVVIFCFSLSRTGCSSFFRFTDNNDSNTFTTKKCDWNENMINLSILARTMPARTMQWIVENTIDWETRTKTLKNQFRFSATNKCNNFVTN